MIYLKHTSKNLLNLTICNNYITVRFKTLLPKLHYAAATREALRRHAKQGIPIDRFISNSHRRPGQIERRLNKTIRENSIKLYERNSNGDNIYSFPSSFTNLIYENMIIAKHLSFPISQVVTCHVEDIRIGAAANLSAKS